MGVQAVARFVRRLDRDELVSLHPEEATALLYGLVGLGFRSAHAIQAWCAALREPATQDALGLRPDTEDDVKRLALENLVNLVSLRVATVIPPHFEIVRGLCSDVVLADQVALVAPGNAGELYIPLSPAPWSASVELLDDHGVAHHGGVSGRWATNDLRGKPLSPMRRVWRWFRRRVV